MQIDQILVRPQQDKVIIQFSDVAGRTTSKSKPYTGHATAQQLVAESQREVPPEEEHPAKGEIEQEIAALEYRLAQLKQSIGVT
jgi:hypothetical protein